MLSTKNIYLITLADDDEIDFEVKDALKKRFAGTSALANLLRVKAAAEKHSAEYTAKGQRIQTLQAKKADAQAFVRDMEREIARGMQYPPKEMERKAAAEQKIAAIMAEIAALRNAPQSTNLPDDTIIEWIRDSKVNFVDAEVKVTTLPKGKTQGEAVEELRNRQRDLNGEKQAVVKQPVPFEDALARVIADVDAKARAMDVRPAMRLKTSVNDYVSHRVGRHSEMQGHVEWPSAEEIVESGRRVEMDQGNALVSWLFRDEIIARGTAELKKHYGNAKGMSAEERARRIAEIDAEILEAERQEEAFIRMAEDAGMTIWRRPNAHPLAVLGIAPA
ncbi:hypothetical protein KMZ68_02090 [Bradyrhizobium sediminis]|uniref:Uncharacterized protein n=1 Tax=Bradyrhizobium sediminis TaxID=2840469 RepID=A0A975NQA8_9BRAD|nr:hypothetical protein [Bradyrhizobium sediminis]QWG18711.1 hypothetical protein KMZ68_02090 [Bradyrhizobium sediminis]